MDNKSGGDTVCLAAGYPFRFAPAVKAVVKTAVEQLIFAIIYTPVYHMKVSFAKIKIQRAWLIVGCISGYLIINPFSFMEMAVMNFPAVGRRIGTNAEEYMNTFIECYNRYRPGNIFDESYGNHLFIPVFPLYIIYCICPS